MINIQSKNGNSKFFLLTLLGMLTAFGPFVTDMYLPSLPSMGEYFKTTPSLVQLGLTASMIEFQIVIVQVQFLEKTILELTLFHLEPSLLKKQKHRKALQKMELL